MDVSSVDQCSVDTATYGAAPPGVHPAAARASPYAAPELTHDYEERTDAAPKITGTFLWRDPTGTFDNHPWLRSRAIKDVALSRINDRIDNGPEIEGDDTKTFYIATNYDVENLLGLYKDGMLPLKLTWYDAVFTWAATLGKRSNGLITMTTTGIMCRKWAWTITHAELGKRFMRAELVLKGSIIRDEKTLWAKLDYLQPGLDSRFECHGIHWVHSHFNWWVMKVLPRIAWPYPDAKCCRCLKSPSWSTSRRLPEYERQGFCRECMKVVLVDYRGCLDWTNKP